MTFVIVMKVAMTIQGSLTFDDGNDLVMTVIIVVLVMMVAITLVMAMMMVMTLMIVMVAMTLCL